MTVRRLVVASMAGVVMSTHGRVAMLARPSPAAVAAARERLRARHANCSRAALALKRAESRHVSGPFFSSARSCSTIALPPVELVRRDNSLLVMNAWYLRRSNRGSRPCSMCSPSRFAHRTRVDRRRARP